jgi:hypothetical protein
MNRKQLTTLLVAGLLIGGLGIFLYNRANQSWRSSTQKTGDRILKDFPLNDVSQVRIKTGTAELNLVRTDEVWRVRERYDYPAAFSEIGDMLRKVWEMKAVQTLAVGPSQLGRLELQDPSKGGTNGTGTLVEFKGKDGKVLAQLLLGKKHMRQGDDASPMGGEGGFPDGRFLMVPGGSQASIIRDALSNIEPKPDGWLSKDFIKVEKLRSVAVTHTNAASSWKLQREQENGEMKLADLKEGELLDNGKSSGAGWVLSSASFADIANPQAKPEETGLDHPTTAVIETFDGLTYTVKIGAKSGEENHYMTVSIAANLAKERVPGNDEKPEDKERLDKDFKEKLSKLEEKIKQEKTYEKSIYLVARWTVEALLKERKDLLMEKKAEAPAEAAAPENAVELPK